MLRLAAQPVHGDGQRLVRLGRDRAVAHRPGGEPLDDRLDRLDLLDRHRLALVELELEQAAERAEPLVLLVDQAGVLLEDVVPARLGGVLEPEDGLGVEQVVLAVAAPLVLAAPRGAGPAGRRGWRRRGGGGRASRAAISSRPIPPTREAVLSKYCVDEVLVEADRLEDLGAAIALDRADAHLGHHLDDALLDRLAIAVDGLVVVDAR